jgi:hypothetical protein
MVKWGRISFKYSIIMIVRSWTREHPINSKEQLVNTRFKKFGSGALMSKPPGSPYISAYREESSTIE